MEWVWVPVVAIIAGVSSTMYRNYVKMRIAEHKQQAVSLPADVDRSG